MSPDGAEQCPRALRFATLFCRKVSNEMDSGLDTSLPPVTP